jgi:hypothetical protein
MPRGYSEVVFSLTQLRIASYNILTDTFGAPVDLPETQTLEFAFETDTDEIKAEGYLQHLLTVMTHATFKLSSAGVPFEALAILTGASNASSGSTPNRSRRMRFDAGGSGLPYFAVAGKLVGEQGDDLHVGLAVCKLDAAPGWKAEQNKFVIQQAEGRAIKRANGRLVYLLGNETAAALDFNSLFAMV